MIGARRNTFVFRNIENQHGLGDLFGHVMGKVAVCFSTILVSAWARLVATTRNGSPAERLAQTWRGAQNSQPAIFLSIGLTSHP
jgi:hypothetical protein